MLCLLSQLNHPHALGSASQNLKNLWSSSKNAAIYAIAVIKQEKN